MRRKLGMKCIVGQPIARQYIDRQRPTSDAGRGTDRHRARCVCGPRRLCGLVNALLPCVVAYAAAFGICLPALGVLGVTICAPSIVNATLPVEFTIAWNTFNYWLIAMRCCDCFVWRVADPHSQAIKS